MRGLSAQFLGDDSDWVAELQTPLLGIAANARVASSKLEPGQAKIAEYLQAIEFSSKSLIRTLDVAMRSQDLANNTLSLETEPLHVGLCIEEAIEKLAPLCRVQAQILSYSSVKNTIVTANKECLDLALYHIFEQALRSSSTEEIVDIKLVQRGGLAQVMVLARGGREKASSIRSALGAGSKRTFGASFSLAASCRLIGLMGGSTSITQRRDGVSFLIRVPVSRQASLV